MSHLQLNIYGGGTVFNLKGPYVKMMLIEPGKQQQGDVFSKLGDAPPMLVIPQPPTQQLDGRTYVILTISHTSSR
jgi:hypothetical protein